MRFLGDISSSKSINTLMFWTWSQIKSVLDLFSFIDQNVLQNCSSFIKILIHHHSAGGHCIISKVSII